MKIFVGTLALAHLMACICVPMAWAQAGPEIGGKSIVTLHRAVINKGVPEFTGVTVAPGRGMELLEITANLPGKGNINVLATPGPVAAPRCWPSTTTRSG